MKYYLLKEVLGYSTGIEDEFNPSPKGALIFDTEKELASQVELTEVEVAEELDSFGEVDEPLDSVKVRLKKLNTTEHKAVLKAAEVKGYSKLKEDQLIELRIKHNLY